MESPPVAALVITFRGERSRQGDLGTVIGTIGALSDGASGGAGLRGPLKRAPPQALSRGFPGGWGHPRRNPVVLGGV